jgi:hypothetical protein
MIIQTSEYGQRLMTLWSEFQHLSLTPDLIKEIVLNSEEIQEGHAYWSLLKSFVDIQDDINDAQLTPEVRNSVQQYMEANATEFAFLFLVAVPCWLIYKEWPSILYRKAVRGDTRAIHKLLRLDPFTLHDPAIGKQIQHVRIHGDKAVYEEFLSAPLKPIKVKLTSRATKDMMAGLISLFAKRIRQPLTATEIRDLIDAMADNIDGPQNSPAASA